MKKKDRRSRYRTQAPLHDWMERTNTTGTTLGELAGISQPHMSRILARKRRCSLEKALNLARITGVPVENLVQWLSDAPRA